MFACAMYPTDSSFLSSVSVEVQQTIRRLGRHASVIVWSANNENEAALVQDWYHTRAQFDKYARDYVALYVGDMEAAVAAEDVSRPYFTSSPSNGAEEKSEGYLAKNPQSEFFGDVHHYNCD
jgi:beta-mannosidase